MKPAEAARVLKHAAIYDGRVEVNDGIAFAWSRALGRLTEDEAKLAVDRFYRAEKLRKITVADVIELVKPAAEATVSRLDAHCGKRHCPCPHDGESGAVADAQALAMAPRKRQPRCYMGVLDLPEFGVTVGGAYVDVLWRNCPVCRPSSQAGEVPTPTNSGNTSGPRKMGDMKPGEQPWR